MHAFFRTVQMADDVNRAELSMANPRMRGSASTKAFGKKFWPAVARHRAEGKLT